MIKKIYGGMICLTLLLVTPFIFYLIQFGNSPLYSQVVTFTDNKVIYELPYPGILPDHPLYFFKAGRDRVLDWTTRDNIKKAELFLLLADKRMAMAIQLKNKGKIKSAITTFEKGEKYFLKIPELLIAAKEQGVSPQEGLIYRVRLSSDKHHEIIQTFMKELPLGQEKDINQLLVINQKIKDELKAL